MGCRRDDLLGRSAKTVYSLKKLNNGMESRIEKLCVIKENAQRQKRGTKMNFVGIAFGVLGKTLYEI
jgi:hypothetical protein